MINYQIYLLRNIINIHSWLRKEPELDDIKQIALLFVEDIKEYISLGGTLDNLNATDVYTLIDKYENKDKED